MLISHLMKAFNSTCSFYHTHISTGSHGKWVADEDERLRYDYPLSETSIVLDVGGYLGDRAARIASRYGCSVYVFEPSQEFLGKLQSRFAADAGIHLFGFGLH